MRRLAVWLMLLSMCPAQTVVSTGNHRKLFTPAGTTNHARQFNGTSSDFLQSAAALSGLTGSNPWSLSFDLYWDAFANDDHIALETSANFISNTGAFLVIPDTSSDAPGQFEWAIAVGSGSAYHFCAIPRPSAAAWHHYVLTMSTGTNTETCTGYIDGVSKTVTSGHFNNPTGIAPHSQVLNVMARNGGASLQAAGRISSIAIYDGIISSTDASSLASCARPTSVTSATLQYYWPINQTSPEVPTTGSQNLNVTGTTNVASVCSF